MTGNWPGTRNGEWTFGTKSLVAKALLEVFGEGLLWSKSYSRFVLRIQPVDATIWLKLRLKLTASTDHEQSGRPTDTSSLPPCSPGMQHREHRRRRRTREPDRHLAERMRRGSPPPNLWKVT